MMEVFSQLSFTAVMLALCAALAFAGVGWWVAWLATGLGEEAKKFDYGQIGFLIAMLPIARRLGNYPDWMRVGGLAQYEEWANHNLNLSGLDEIFTPREYVGSHLVLLLLGLALPLVLLLYPDSSVSIIFLMSLILGFSLLFLPFIVLKDIIDKRRRAIFKALPYFLDLVTLLVESGMDFGFAMDRAAQQIGAGPLQDEVNRFSRQIQLGQPRRKALTELADRSDLAQMKTLATALIQQEQLGSRIETVLRRQSEILRFSRMQEAESMANKAPVKILVPMVLFIFPSIFLVLIGPMVIRAYMGTP